MAPSLHMSVCMRALVKKCLNKKNVIIFFGAFFVTALLIKTNVHAVRNYIPKNNKNVSIQEVGHKVSAEPMYLSLKTDQGRRVAKVQFQLRVDNPKTVKSKMSTRTIRDVVRLILSSKRLDIVESPLKNKILRAEIVRQINIFSESYTVYDVEIKKVRVL